MRALLESSGARNGAHRAEIDRLGNEWTRPHQLRDPNGRGSTAIVAWLAACGRNTVRRAVQPFYGDLFSVKPRRKPAGASEGSG